MPDAKIKRTYRFDRATVEAIDAIAERERTSATEAVARAVAAYASGDDGRAAGAPDTATGRAIDALAAQLEAKDRQIADLSAALAAAQDTAKAAQALQASALKQLEAPEPQGQRRGLWARLRGR